jgi:glutaminyl-tRNA synthetase
LQVMRDCKIEPSMRDAEPGAKYQFERLGYYCVDRDSGDKLVFNRTIGLRDTWAKIEKRASK